MAKSIVQKEDPVLRKRAEEVDQKAIGSKDIQHTIVDMKESLAQEKDGVAIAAPQIGVSLRIFIVAGKIFKNNATENIVEVPDLVFINPKISIKKETFEELEEGCLSVRGVYGVVPRALGAHIDALDERGEKVSMDAEGLLAQIFQHETDHLDGVLFIDKAKNIEHIDPEKKGRNKDLEEKLPNNGHGE